MVIPIKEQKTVKYKWNEKRGRAVYYYFIPVLRRLLRKVTTVN